MLCMMVLKTIAVHSAILTVAMSHSESLHFCSVGIGLKLLNCECHASDDSISPDTLANFLSGRLWLQFAFLAFVVGHSLEAFGQWKALLHLLLACEAAPLHKRPKFYSHLLQAVQVWFTLLKSQNHPRIRMENQGLRSGVGSTVDLLGIQD